LFRRSPAVRAGISFAAGSRNLGLFVEVPGIQIFARPEGLKRNTYLYPLWRNRLRPQV
jgi:hypothetical protein